MQTAVPQASPSLAPAPASDDATALGAADSKACHQWQLWQEMALGELMRCRTTRASGRQVVGAAPRQDWAQSLPPSAILALA